MPSSGWAGARHFKKHPWKCTTADCQRLAASEHYKNAIWLTGCQNRVDERRKSRPWGEAHRTSRLTCGRAQVDRSRGNRQASCTLPDQVDRSKERIRKSYKRTYASEGLDLRDDDYSRARSCRCPREAGVFTTQPSTKNRANWQSEQNIEWQQGAGSSPVE